MVRGAQHMEVLVWTPEGQVTGLQDQCSSQAFPEVSMSEPVGRPLASTTETGTQCPALQL